MLVIVLVRNVNWKEWKQKHKQGEVSRIKEKCLRTVYQVKYKAERKRFVNATWRNEQRCDVFKIAKRMVKTNQYIIDEQFIRNVGVLAVSSEDKKIAWKSYHEKLLSTGFAWDWNSLSHVRMWNCKRFIILRQLQEKYLTKKMHFGFVDLQKVFYRVPRHAVWWALRKLGVKEWLVRTVQSTYRNAQSRVRANATLSDNFLAQVVLHQDSV